MIDCKNFSLEYDQDILCPCCNSEMMDDQFMEQLDFARTIAGVPFIINSGFRCENYQDELKSQGFETAKGLSPHEKGMAVDIRCDNPQVRPVILTALKEVGFDRFGLAHNFIHVDNDPDRSLNRIWLYNRRK